jgi:hypothetical protein
MGTFPKEAITSVLSRQPQTSKYTSIEVNIYIKKVWGYYNSVEEKNKVPQCGC